MEATQTLVQEKVHAPLWVVLGIYLSIFINSYVFFTSPFEFQFGYLVYLVLLPGFIRRLGTNRNLFFIFLILLGSGIFNILAGNNTAALFFKVFTGLMLSYFFYDYVIRHFKFDVERLFRWYLKGAYIAALLGLFQFVCFKLGYKSGYTFWGVFNKWAFAPGGLFGIRVNSIFSEPTHLAAVLSAAFFVAVYNLTRKETFGLSRFESLVVIVVYLLSFSGLGQAGIFLTLLFLSINFGLVRYILLLIPAFLFLFNFLYNNVVDFRDRFDGLAVLYRGEEFRLGQTHGSSFILYNNYYVAMENFKTNFVFGGGIGSHPVAFDKHSKAKEIMTYGFNLNSADANSMMLRLISETGLFGVVLFLGILFKFYVARSEDSDSQHWIISNSILIMIILNLFRQGHYFLNGFPFFVLLYIYNYLSYHGLLSGWEDKDPAETTPVTAQDAGKR